MGVHMVNLITLLLICFIGLQTTTYISQQQTKQTVTEKNDLTKPKTEPTIFTSNWTEHKNNTESQFKVISRDFQKDLQELLSVLSTIDIEASELSIDTEKKELSLTLKRSK